MQAEKLLLSTYSASVAKDPVATAKPAWMYYRSYICNISSCADLVQWPRERNYGRKKSCGHVKPL